MEYVWAQNLCLQRQKSQAQRVDTVKIWNIGPFGSPPWLATHAPEFVVAPNFVWLAVTSKKHATLVARKSTRIYTKFVAMTKLNTQPNTCL